MQSFKVRAKRPESCGAGATQEKNTSILPWPIAQATARLTSSSLASMRWKSWQTFGFRAQVSGLGVQGSRFRDQGLGVYRGLEGYSFRRFQEYDTGGCQNYGPFLDPYYNTAPNF